MIRSSLLSLLVGALLVPAISLQAAPRFPMVDEWMEEKITPPMQALPIDEALLALSKAASANVLADATHFEAGRIVPPYPSQKDPYDSGFGQRVGVIGQQAFQAGLSYDRSASDTLVFWKQPDKDRLVSLIVAYQKQLDKQFPRGDDKNTLTGFQEFLKARYGWSAQAQTPEEAVKRAQGVDGSFRLSDLPEALRAPFRAEFISRVRSPGSMPTHRWFEADYWKDTRVQLRRRRQAIYDAEGNFKGQREGSAVELAFPDVRDEEARSITINPPVQIGFPHTTPAGGFTPAKAAAQTRQGVRPDVAPAVELPAEGPAPAALPGANVEGEPSLQKAVVFSAKQQPLAQFVAALGKQSGVALSVAPDVAPDAKVTGCSVAAGMPLASAMSALSRLYSARWTKDGNGYTLNSEHPTELTRTMAQMGISAFYGWAAFMPQERDALGAERADEVLGAVNVAQLQKSPGVPFSSLPVDTQDSVLQLFQREHRGDLIATQQRLHDALDQEVVFRFAPLAVGAPLFYGAEMAQSFGTGRLSPQSSGIGAYSSDGAFIAHLFPRFTFRPPTQEQIRFYQAEQAYAEHMRNQEGNGGR